MNQSLSSSCACSRPYEELSGICCVRLAECIAVLCAEFAGVHSLVMIRPCVEPSVRHSFGAVHTVVACMLQRKYRFQNVVLSCPV